MALPSVSTNRIPAPPNARSNASRLLAMGERTPDSKVLIVLSDTFDRVARAACVQPSQPRANALF